MSYIKKDLPELARGDTWTLKYTITDSNKQPVDISGLTYWMTIKPDPDSADPGVAQISTVAGSPDAAQGIITIIFPSNVTDVIDPANYYYDLQQVNSSVSPPKVDTLIIGRVKVVKDITTSI